MKMKIFPLLLACCIIALTLPPGARVVHAQSEEEILQQQVVAELEAFAATHTLDELKAEVFRRIDTETTTNLNRPQLLKPVPKLSGEDEWGVAECIQRRTQSCRLTFEADIITHAAGTITAAVACTAFTATTGVILCSAGALVVQSLLNSAASRRQEACRINAIQDCIEPQDIR